MSEFTGMNKLEAMAQIAKVGYDEGVKDTEERIIKLLEAHSEQKFADNFQRNDDLVHEDVCKLCEKFNGLGVAIALIKGENK